MKKSYVIRAICRDTGKHFYSHTSNVKQRIESLKKDIVNQKFPRVEGFTLSNVNFEIYKQVGVETPSVDTV